MEHELALTALFNDYLAGAANSLLAIFGQHADNPARPWANFMTMQILVALIIVVLFAVLRSRLSVDKPGTTQHIFELVYNFLKGQAHDTVGHDGHLYVAYFGTVFIFILFSNLLGIIPGLESPTMFVYVPCGCALATFAYYNGMGVKQQGTLRYLAHFCGPILLLAPLMLPIELISNFARPLSLTVRLYANMVAGEQVTIVFLGLVPLVVPAIFMALHVFVAFLQAYVFTLLSMVYVGGAVAHEEH